MLVGGAKGNWLAPLMGPIKAMLLNPFVEQEMVLLLARMDKDDLATLGELMREEKLTPVIDSRYSLSEVPAAIRHSEEGHARGKIVINIEPQTNQD